MNIPVGKTASRDRSNHQPMSAPSNSMDDEAADSRHWEFRRLAQVNTSQTTYPAYASELQPGLFRPPKERKFANAVPLGLGGFALTTFIAGCVNVQTLGITKPNIVVGAAIAYGGLVQICAGMWAMAADNTFGATALSSYGGFRIALAIIFTPGRFDIEGQLVENGNMDMYYNSVGLFFMAWSIFTFLLMICTLKSTVVFFTLFFDVTISFFLNGIGYICRDAANEPNQPVIKAAGVLMIISSFLAWWVMLAGIADNTNSFFIFPVYHFPWSEKGRSSRKAEEQIV